MKKFYRSWVKDSDLLSFEISIKETDLLIRAKEMLKEEAINACSKCRSQLEQYISRNQEFSDSLVPIAIRDDAPGIVRDMVDAAAKVGVGPMAAVAGTVAEYVGKALLKLTNEVIVENGGDIFAKVTRRRMIGIYAGKSALTGQIAVQIDPDETPLGICTSSGTFGHSLSFGKANAVVVLSSCTPLADATATAVGNLIKDSDDIQKGLKYVQNIAGIRGILIIVGDKMGIWGEMKIKKMEGDRDLQYQ